MSSSVIHEVNRAMDAARALKANLKDILADDDNAFVRDMIEGETNLFETIDMCLAQIVTDKALCEGLDTHMSKIKARSDRFETRINSVRTAILAAMEMAGVKKHEAAIATVSRSPVPPSLVIPDDGEANIPSKYWEAQPPKLDRRMLLADLKARQKALEEAAKRSESERASAIAAVDVATPAIPGAQLSNGGETVRISWS